MGPILTRGGAIATDAVDPWLQSLSLTGLRTPTCSLDENSLGEWAQFDSIDTYNEYIFLVNLK